MIRSLHKPLLIGVTGGIGSGKSVVCRLFDALGIPVYVADERAKWLVSHDAILKADIIRLLGPEAYDLAGRYNRPWIAAQVFSQPELLIQLNAIIHPRVYADTDAWALSHADKPYLIKEAAIMTPESKGTLVDEVVVVYAPLELRMQRIQQRDAHRSAQEITNIISSQVSDEDRFKIADYIVYNDETHLLIPQIIRLHETFVAQATRVA